MALTHAIDSTSVCATNWTGCTQYLDGPRAAAVDKELMSDAVGFTLDQLMELAGLSCAQAIEHFYPKRQPVLIVCGPGSQ